MERLDFRKSNAFLDAKDRLRAFASGENISKSNESGLTKAIVRQRAVISNMQDAGEDTTKEELKLKRMEDRLGQQKPVEPKQQKNPWKKKIDDTQIKIQDAEEKLRDADPAYANELKKSIARMNAELDMYYQQASDWQPVQEAVFSYMEEQTYRDSKTNTKGKFVDKGYKKFDNYGKWMMFNE